MAALTRHMARIARTINDNIRDALEQDPAHIRLRDAYRQCCEVHQAALSGAEFADMAAQLLVYSCFVARYYHCELAPFQRQHITQTLTYAHPLHRQCVEAITSMGQGSTAIAACIDELVRLLVAFDRDTIASAFAQDAYQDDPLAHF